MVGTGFHGKAGEPHAEIEALRRAGAKARNATLYVTLEPCAHHGRTPPCSKAIIAAGVCRVVLGVRDPNPHVRGGGLEDLRAAGVRVEVGVGAAACAGLSRGSRMLAQPGLPFGTLQRAGSLDVRIATATGASRWITGAKARRLVHRLRNENDAVMVGAGTVAADDPALTCRIPRGRDPLRVVVDGRFRVPLGARVLTKEAAPGTLVVTAMRKEGKIRILERSGAEVLVLPGRGGRLSIAGLLAALGERGIASVLVEGGATLAAAALREGVVDRLLCFCAPMFIGGDGTAMLGSLGVRTIAAAIKVGPLRVRRVGSDVLLQADLGDAHAV